MRGHPGTASCGEGSGSDCVSTFTCLTSEQAEIAIRHVSLGAGCAMKLRASTMDQACTLILHLSATDNFELHDVTGLLWSGRCVPGAVDVVANREELTLKASHGLEALVLGIPRLSMPRVAPTSRADRGADRGAAHDSRDAVGHELGLAFLAAAMPAADPAALAAVHLARALCCHFAAKHAWVRTSAGRGRLAPWQSRRAAQLLERGDIQVREVAAACRLSSRAFSRLFRATFLRSPLDWKAERRINVVKELLRVAEIPLADAALQAGFADQGSMSRSFRRLVGASPGAWRKSLRKEEV